MNLNVKLQNIFLWKKEKGKSMKKKDFTKKQTTIILVVGMLFCLGIAAIVFIQQLPKTKDFGSSGKFEASVVEEQTKVILDLFTNKEYQKILDEYANKGLKEDAKAEDLAYAATGLGGDLGEIKEIESISLAEMEKGGVLYAVSESKVVYENITVIFTFSFNEKMEFSGIYLQEYIEKDDE